MSNLGERNGREGGPYTYCEDVNTRQGGIGSGNGRRRGNRRNTSPVVPILLAAAIVTIAAVVVVAMGTPASSSSQASQGSFTSITQPQAATSQAAFASSESQTASSASEAAAEEGDDLSWRDEDFAVDASRDTDWSYESNGEKVVYLTFDDGPSENTQDVLDILDEYGCKATFFVTSEFPDYAYMMKVAYDKGHTIGMHTYSHDYATVYASEDAYFEDLAEIADVVSSQIGYVPCFIRFPGGSSNTVSANYTTGIMSALSEDVVSRGYQYYDWNASCGDGSNHTTEEIISYACDYDDYTNIIMLMHDSAAKDTTVEALPTVIEHYQELGYEFKAIDRTTMVPHHGIGN